MRQSCSILVALAVLAAGLACARPSADVPATPVPQQDAPQAGPSVAPQTALMVLELHPDGSVALVDVRLKPVVYRGPVRTVAAAAQHAGLPVAPGALTPVPGSQAALPHVHVGGAEHAGGWTLRAQHPDHAPVLVDVDLGTPGEGGGDIVDRWAGGSVVVRAPAWGSGTTFALLQGSVEKVRGGVTP